MQDWLDDEECALCGAEGSLSFDDGEIYCCCCDDYSYLSEYPDYEPPMPNNVVSFNTPVKNRSTSINEAIAKTRKYYVKHDRSYGNPTFKFVGSDRPDSEWERRINKNIEYYNKYGKLPG